MLNFQLFKSTSMSTFIMKSKIMAPVKIRKILDRASIPDNLVEVDFFKL